MICFPLDNTEYEANALGAWCGTRTRGVFAADGHYEVTASGGMSVSVSPGLAWLKADAYWGVNAFEDTAQTFTLKTADGAVPRIDIVCVRLDKNRNIGEIVIKTGAYSPQPPQISPPVRNIDFDEIYIATIRVRPGATAVLASDITDQRLNENYCGLMRDGVTGAHDYEAWFSTFKSDTAIDYDAWFAALQEILDRANALASESGVMDTVTELADKLIVSPMRPVNQRVGGVWFDTSGGASDIEDGGGSGQTALPGIVISPDEPQTALLWFETT